MNKYVVFKTLTKPIENFSKVQLQDTQRRLSDDSKLSLNEWMSLDPNYSEVDMVFVSGIIDDQVKSSKLLSFEEFLTYAEKYDKHVTWVGWNCLGFDQPHILFNMQKKDYGHEITNLFNMGRFKTKPVFDMMQILYNWNYPRSLALTADSMGLEVKDIVLENIFQNENEPMHRKIEWLQETGNLMVNLFLKIKKYYF